MSNAGEWPPNVIPIPAKHTEGGKRNTSWSVTFNKETRKWMWRVTVSVVPQVFEGEANSEVLANLEVQGIVSKLVR